MSKKPSSNLRTFHLVCLFTAVLIIILGAAIYLRSNNMFRDQDSDLRPNASSLKTIPYASASVTNILDSSNLIHAIRIASTTFLTNFNLVFSASDSSNTSDLMLPTEQWERQQQGGTWSEYFNPTALQNRYEILGVILWYLSLGLLGLAVYPILRAALPGLKDGGYPLARTAGLLILSYLVWITGSLGGTFTRPTITVVLGLILLTGGSLAYIQRAELLREWRERRKYYLIIEGILLVFFVAALLIRFGNPDLWHQWKGGEKPMDFAYFNAVLKSTTFPPYDPWYAGGYLNYYYYGFVFVGVLVKWLGIVPSFAYNLILPTIFSLIAMGAFSIAWNIYQGSRASQAQASGEPDTETKISTNVVRSSPWLAGIAAALLMAVLGNLGTVGMIFQGFQKLAAPNGNIDNGTLVTRVGWVVQGFERALTGQQLPYGLADWYWNPSRAIPVPPGDVEPITEFPFFTFLYGDPHAHLFAMPIALLALGFITSVVLARGRWRNWINGAIGFLIGGLAIGALRPTNTWDFYPYLALGVVAVGYSLWANHYPSDPQQKLLRRIKIDSRIRDFLVGLSGIVLLVGLSYILYQPYAKWYGQGYNNIDPWTGQRTPLFSYLGHWGLFLFIIASWMAWETIDWMAKTPLSALRKLTPYKNWIWSIVVLLFTIMLILGVKIPNMPDPSGNQGLLRWLTAMPGRGVTVAFLALPFAAWAGVLILRPNQSPAKRLILFLVGTGLAMTLLVEVAVLRGDVARMNMVFKFYLQAWTLFAVSAAAALSWLFNSISAWSPRSRNTWSIALILLVFGAALYPITATRGKVLDRMVTEAPHTLDGMTYMAYASYDWKGMMDLSEDYRAIRWMQDNVIGSPVIVEANLRDLYRWGSRFSIYTGLPSVVGWEWHQQQQRALLPGSLVSDRINEINDFYNTTDITTAEAFLRKYHVQYIILGQLERNVYPGPGLGKFEASVDTLWREIYRDGKTVIYQTLEK